eukprot:gb/GECG01013227.1/.p1 GENE.gb/GECG01013227.1/~~gb/GECG01013227.1/.p1  ORF type:complete len:648 (+),score=51.88 gb/GECG01013227.1/:1-1944(+)
MLARRLETSAMGCATMARSTRTLAQGLRTTGPVPSPPLPTRRNPHDAWLHRAVTSTSTRRGSERTGARSITHKEAARVKREAQRINGQRAARTLIASIIKGRGGQGEWASALTATHEGVEEAESPVVNRLAHLWNLKQPFSAYAHLRSSIESLADRGERKKIQQIVQWIAWEGGLHQDTLMQDVVLRSMLPEPNAPAERLKLQKMNVENNWKATGYQPFRPLPLPREALQILLWLYELAFWEGNQIVWTAWWQRVIRALVSICELEQAREAFEWFGRLSRPYGKKEFNKERKEMVRKWGAAGRVFTINLPQGDVILPRHLKQQARTNTTLPGTGAYVRWPLVSSLVPQYCYYEMARLKLSETLHPEIEASLQETPMDIGSCLNLLKFQSLIHLPPRHVWSYSRKRRLKAHDSLVLAQKMTYQSGVDSGDASINQQVEHVLSRFVGVHENYCEHLRWVWVRAMHHPDINAADSSHRTEMHQLEAGEIDRQPSRYFTRHAIFEQSCLHTLLATMSHSDDPALVERAASLAKIWVRNVCRHALLGVEMHQAPHKSIALTHVLSECAVSRKFSSGVDMLYELSALLEEYREKAAHGTLRGESMLVRHIDGRLEGWTRRFVQLASLRMVKDAVDMLDSGRCKYLRLSVVGDM